MIARTSRPVVALASSARRLAIAEPSPRPFARLFGAPTVETVNGPLAGRAVQRHRIALLALLATARRGSRPRDQLIDLLWPDAGADRGRRLLSDSLYRINSALAVEALTGRGDSIEVDRSLLGSDVFELEEAIDAHDWPRAIRLHQSPFLDGFYLPGAVEFDQWMEAQRVRFQRSVTKAGETLNADARGIAVMPFRYIGSADGLGELVEVLVEEISAALGRRTTIPVASQSASFTLRDALDMRELGRRLNVAWVVDGSVRQSGDALRIVARLTDTSSGYQVWTETFDRSASGIAADIMIAESIAVGVGERLQRMRASYGISSVR